MILLLEYNIWFDKSFGCVNTWKGDCIDGFNISGIGILPKIKYIYIYYYIPIKLKPWIEFIKTWKENNNITKRNGVTIWQMFVFFSVNWRVIFLRNNALNWFFKENFSSFSIFNDIFSFKFSSLLFWFSFSSLLNWFSFSSSLKFSSFSSSSIPSSNFELILRNTCSNVVIDNWISLISNFFE